MMRRCVTCMGRSATQRVPARSAHHGSMLRLKSHPLLRNHRAGIQLAAISRPSISTIDANRGIGVRAATTTSSKVEDLSKLSPVARARHWAGIYAELSKVRLSALVVMTTGAGYLFSGAATTAGIGPFAAVAVGTTLAACSANTFNQAWEVRNDLRMKRTAKRPLPSGRISKPHALAWGFGTGATSAAILALGANPLTAALGVGNIALYSLVYTPMKVRSEWNTWVGSLVGAIPPVMGYTAATGILFTPESALLAGVLFLWQMPHFFALSWRLRQDYARGGFQMVAVNDPSGARTAELVWRYSLYMAPLPVLAAAGGMTTWMFAAEGMALNAYLLYLSRQFLLRPNPSNSHKVFLCTLWYLPVLLGLMCFHKTADASTLEDGNGQYRELSLVDSLVNQARGFGKDACIHEALLENGGLCPKVLGGAASETAANTDVQLVLKIDVEETTPTTTTKKM